MPDPKILPFKKKKFSPVFDKNEVRISYLRIYNATGEYYVRKTFKRYRIPELFEALGVNTLGKAKSAAEERIKIHQDHWLGEKRAIDANRFGAVTAGKVIDEIFDTYTPTQRKRTQEQHRLYLGELKREWGRVDISRISLLTWTKWLNDFRRKKKRKTYNDYRKHMLIVLNYAYQHRYLTHLVKLPNPDVSHETRFRLLSKEELEKLYAAMSEDTRDQFVLSYECYMRYREVLFLTWDRVNLNTGEITLRAEDVKTGSKTGKGRSFIASDNAIKRLRERKARQEKPSPYVFPNPHDPSKPVQQNVTAWRATQRRAGIHGVRWHDLRHTAISHAVLIHHVPPILVSEYAGLSIKTLQRVYLHSTADKTKGARVLSIGEGK